MRRSIWIGWDPREAAAFAVCRHSIKRHLSQDIPINGLVLDNLRARGLYSRPSQTRINSDGYKQLWDTISDAPMATEFSNSRFLVPQLAVSGLALFMDCDMLARADLVELFDYIESQPRKAVWCVKHRHEPTNTVKMDGQVQTIYARKNWSSVCVFDVVHPANRSLTLDVVNKATGRDLHRFFWLADCDIGELPVEWNWLAGHSTPSVVPKIVHHTDGSPCMAGYENAAYAGEWRAELNEWALSGAR